MAKSGYNTGLAAEFFVLSVLHRKGVDANLTLGNRKSVDIAAVRRAGDAVTIDVKGLAGKTGWPVDNIREPKSNHFVVFVCFVGKIDDATVVPEVWVVPSRRVPSLMYLAPGGNRRLVTRKTLNTRGARYRDAWHLIT